MGVVGTLSTQESFISFSQCHPGKVRSSNEDAVLELCHDGVWVVADGMGGHAAGDVASRMVVDAIEQCVDCGRVDIEHLGQALAAVNQQILEYSRTHLKGKTVGSTVALLFIRDGFYHCLWVGDSRIYLMRNRRLAQVTRDHSQVMEMVDQGVISADDAEHHPLANVITRAVGVAGDLSIDHVTEAVCGGDLFLLCSDGLSNELSHSALTRCMQAYSVSDTALALMHSALVKGARDNVSCVLVKVGAACASSVPDEDTVPVFADRREL